MPRDSRGDSEPGSPGYNYSAAENAVNQSPKIYNDRHGMPVLYDQAAQDGEELRKEAVAFLWHDLLSPVVLIEGYTSTLLYFKDSINEEQKEEYLLGINASTKKLVRLLDKLRYVTSLEKTADIATQPIDMADLLRNICSETQTQAREHIISFYPCQPLPKINADPEKIEQVLGNLLDNAIKYSPDKGDIKVEARMVPTEQELRRFFPDAPQLKLPALIISIIDSGIGISENEQEQIFEKFYRGHNRWSHSIKGAGLGLYICKVIVESHGGRIWARKRLQGGSIFSFSLPAASHK